MSKQVPKYMRAFNWGWNAGFQAGLKAGWMARYQKPNDTAGAP